MSHFCRMRESESFMRLTICQTKIEFEEKERNLRHAKELIKEAAEKSSHLIAFPEMSFTGFSMNVQKNGETERETVAEMAALAKRYDINVAFGYVLLRGGKAENHYAIVSSSGEVLSDYIKLHSFVMGGEGDCFRCGNSLPKTVETDGHRITSVICFDLRFGELFRSISDDNSIILVPANWPHTRSEHWKTLLRARAIENQIYVAGINCCGEQGNLKYSGDSMVIDPWGNILACAKPFEEEIITLDIENTVDKARRDFPIRDCRRDKFFNKYLQ